MLDSKYINNEQSDKSVGIHWFNGANETKIYSNNLEERKKNPFKITCFLDKIVQTYL